MFRIVVWAESAPFGSELGLASTAARVVLTTDGGVRCFQVFRFSSFFFFLDLSTKHLRGKTYGKFLVGSGCLIME
jgi:hypothetical protein